jgi:amidase
MNPTDLAFTPAVEQAQLIRQGELSPLDLTRLYLERIQTQNPKLGSFVTVLADQALDQAAAQTEQLTQFDRSELPPFFGVPIAIKDLTAVQGVRCTYGSAAMTNYVSSYDDGVVSRLKQAGFVILGKTSVSELGSLPYTEPMHLPTARNPWNLNHTPGGSSGGAAAAVAAGLVPVAQGSDAGGSVRGPAFCCGLVGLKPSRGRISCAPIGDFQNGIGSHGILARTVTDTAALLDVMAGYLPGDPYWLPDPPQPFLNLLKASSHPPLRIAYTTDIPPVSSADPSTQQAVLTVAQQLASLGHHLEPNTLDFSGLIEPFVAIWRAGVGILGLPPEALCPFNRWLLSQLETSGEYLRAVAAMQGIARRIVSSFESYDVLLLPTYLHPAIPIGAWADLSPEATLQKIIEWIAPCPPFNASGQPALSFPTGLTADGLPVGVQLVGRPAEEATILALAAQLESLNPWTMRPSESNAAEANP